VIDALGSQVNRKLFNLIARGKERKVLCGEKLEESNKVSTGGEGDGWR
jgi:hypothetical protein